MNRRSFLINNSKIALGVSLIPTTGFSMYDNARFTKFISKRPPKDKRTFKSEAVEEIIKEVKKFIVNPELAWMFENCYPNTLDTTVDYEVISDDLFKKHTNNIDKDLSEKRNELLNLNDYQKDLSEYISYGLKLIQNLETLFENGNVNIKNKLLSSIFEEKIEFDGKKYRTPKFKEGFGFIYQNISELQMVKKEKGDKLSNISHLVPWVGIEPTLPRKLDFESSASTSSATKAIGGQNYKIKFTPH